MISDKNDYNVEDIGGVLREIHSYLRKLSRSTMDDEDISGPRFAILMILKHRQPMMVSELKNELQVAMSTVTQMADSLHASGYLQRSRNPTDRRVVMLSLTEKGEQLVSSLKSKHLEHLRNALMVFNDGQRDDFLMHLNKLSQSLKTCTSTSKEVVDG